ncbi:MAG: hypothetical protein IKL02_01540 [Kiritimatiellae bacterium]|nr:hypothetical protein [Kiritimatiellia bacterium]
MLQAAVDIDNYLFRYDFSAGTKKFCGSTGFSVDPLSDKKLDPSDRMELSVLPIDGPDGANTAAHPMNTGWTAGSSSANSTTIYSLLSQGDWTCAMSVRPGATQNGVLFSIGRRSADRRKGISICASSNPNEMIVDENIRSTSKSQRSSNVLNNGVDVSRGFHTVVVVYRKPASGYAGTAEFYIDGVYQKSITTANYEFGGGFQFCSTCSGLQGDEVSTETDLDVAFRDLRFYRAAFTAADVKKYAALFPADGLRKSAFVRAYGVNAVDTDYSVTPQTRIGIDCQYADLTTAKRMFGAGEYNHESLGCAFYIQSQGNFAHIFNDGYDYTDSSLGNKNTATIRRVKAVFDRPAGYSYLWKDGAKTSDKQIGTASGNYAATTTLPLFAEKSTTVTQNFSKAMIYSVDIQESGSLVHFFAPHYDETLGACFKDIVTGEMKGEAMESPTSALTYNDGFGSSADYKYENGTLYAKVYADPAGAAQGTVAVSASGETLTPEADGGYWVAYNTTLTLTATPANGWLFSVWAGDKNALQSGTTATASITVLVDRATQFEARFTPVEIFHAADGGYAASGERSAAATVDPNDVDLVVAENAYGFEGVEAAGSYMVNGSHTFTATTATSGVFGGTAVGYKLEKWNRDTKAWGSVSYGGGNTFAYTNCVANGRMRLTWFWQQSGQVRKYGVGDYIQYDRPSTLLAHFDGIKNAGASAAHETSPVEWVNLVAGGFNLATNKAPAFSQDAWVADRASYFTSASDDVKNALAAKSFTLEMMILNPGGQAKDSYEYWAYFGNGSKNRQLVVDLREPNSKNPLVQGVQYRESGWNDRSKVTAGSITEWNKRQYVAVVCDSAAATTYCDGANQIHRNTGGTLSPSQTGISFGASFDGAWPLYAGSEICAIRMTAGVLEPWQLEYNNAIDQVRFNGNVTIVNGAVGETGRVGKSSATDGVYDVASGTWTVTAEDVVDGRRYKPHLTVETLTDGKWVRTAKLWTDSYTVDKSALDGNRIKLTWTWAIPPGFIITIR